MSNDLGLPLWPVLEHYGWTLPGPRYGWQTVKCGAHDDRHASCRVNNEEGAAFCQACGFSAGSVIDVIQHYEGEGLSFREALTIAEEVTGRSSEHVSRGPNRRSDRLFEGPRSQQGNGDYRSPRLRH